MFVAKTKKYLFAGLGLLLLTFLQLPLSGCNATSDPKVSYQTTGSWQGTIGADQVRGVIAPDRTYHLAIVDAAGNSVGVYVGVIGSIDAENIGSMTLVRLHTTENAGAQQQITFKLSADRLFSLQGIELTRTGEANGPAAPGAVAGHWSIAAADNITDMVVNADGTLSGSDGVNCRYSGTVNLLDPAWNIFPLNITLTDIPGKFCTDADYSGLAMILPPENARRRLWFAANNRIQGGVRTLFGEWSETINVAPVAQMTILGDRTSTAPEESSVLVQDGAAVELDAQGSSDDNQDALLYTWSGTAPDGVTPLNILGTGSAVSFIPLVKGLYTLTLTVRDGIDSNILTRQLRVESTLDRFVGCGNGTVLDTRTNLLWLQDAGCSALNLDPVANQWGFGAATGRERVNALLSAGVCGLNDGSALGAWGLPTVNEFRQIVTTTPFAARPPALLNGKGIGQWIEGDVFINVGVTNNPIRKLYVYWTADSAPDPLNWFFVNFAYDVPENWSESQFAGTLNSLWPVRAVRPGEQCSSVPVP